MTPFTLLTTYIRAQKYWRFASIACVALLVFVGVFGFADRSEAVLPALGIAALTLFTGAIAVKAAEASIISGIVTIIFAIINALREFFLLVVHSIINVSRYTQFIDSIPVTRGWEIIRDLCNMFFVLILLAIAIGTILQHEKYTYSKTLPKLISAAILINFSKTIAGLAIDFANVIMLTFVGAIENTAGGNFVALIGIQDFLQYVNESGAAAEISIPGVFLSLLLTFIFMVVAVIVVVVMLYILIARVVALWFLVVLSPAAFFLSALPDDKGFGKKWWDQFVNYLIVGPVMMFFLWLSFTTLELSGQKSGEIPKISRQISTVSDEQIKGFPGGAGPAVGSPQHTLGTFLGIIMLLGSMMVAQQLGVEGGKMAGGVVEGARAWAAGKKGPSPMRYFRERIGAYSKMRESARQEKAKRDLTLLAKPLALVAAVGGAAKDMAWRKFMTSEKTRELSDPIRKTWDALYTKPKAAIGRFIESASGAATEHTNQAGEATQNAENNRERADRLLMKKEDLKKKQEFLKVQLEELEVVPEDEAPADKVKREKTIKEIKERIGEIEIDINTNELDANDWELRADKLTMEAVRFGTATKPDWLETEKRFETPEEIEKRIGRGIDVQETEVKQLKEQEKKARENAEFLRDYKGTPEEAKEALKKKLSQEYRDKAIGFDRQADIYKNQAQGKEGLALLGRVASVVPDMAVGGLKVGAGLALNLAVPGYGLLLPFAPDMLNAMNGFGRRLMREVDDIQMEAIQGSQKHFSNLRDEVVKAIANGAVKGYSKIEQMGAQREMINRNLYTSEEIGVARRQYGERGARSAALESFDYNVFNKYPSQAYGMTAEQLMRLLEKNRVNLKDISRADAINGELLSAINKLGERLGNNVSAKYLMTMKNDPVVENRMQHEAAKRIREMQEKGQDGFDAKKDDGGKATNDYLQMIKTMGLTRGYIDNPGILDIDRNGNFTGDQKRAKFNRNIVREAMKDDDIAPYLALTMHNEMLSKKDSEVMNIISEMLDPNGPNAKMATHVAAALRNMSTQLADRGKANMANLSQGIVATMERPVFASVLLENDATNALALSLGITVDNVDTIKFTQEQIDKIKKDMKGQQKKSFKEAMANEMESNSIWRKLRWGEDRF